MHSRIHLRLRLKVGDHVLLGPGKADLLEAVDRNGSISAAARAMGMSYKRGWDLVHEMNSLFAQPVVAASFGGKGGGGAGLTDFGRQVLARFRALEACLRAANADDLAWLESQLADKPE